MYNIITIADGILKIAKKQGKALTPLQLMKLVYIAHGWSLGIRDIDLFGERIEAWQYGPVIPDLYHATKRFGRKEIPLDLISDQDIETDKETSKFLEDVFSKYGNLTGFSLSQLTHQSGTPWDEVYQDGVMGIEITDDAIKSHYVALQNGQ